MDKTKTWEQYEKGIDYKTRIGLYNTVNVNERIFNGDQWHGIPHEGLPTPVLNFTDRTVTWKAAAVADRRTSMMMFAEGSTLEGDLKTYIDQLSAYTSTIWERLGMDYKTKEGLVDSAITGDFIMFFWWNDQIQTGQALKGDIDVEMIDNINYYPGDPNQKDVQKQPYIILAFREHVDSLKEEAKRNKIDPKLITGDAENEYTAGDRGKIELDDDSKVTTLLKLWKKDGKILCEKSVRNTVIRSEYDTKLTRYPIALMNWKPRKNSCHGTAEVTAIIPNQIFVNKVLALAMVNILNQAFPKVIYDETRIPEYTNQVGAAIPMQGDALGAIQVVSPANASFDAWRGLEVTTAKTMEMMGANDIVLGNINNPDNTSAFIATRDAAMVPLQLQQQRYYGMLEDIGMIWLDFITHFYKTGRMIPVKIPEVIDGQPTGKEVTTYVQIDSDKLKEIVMKIKIEVGPSTMWSEIQTIQTLDNLLQAGKITLKQYLERMPQGYIKDSDKLAQENDEMMQMQQQLSQATQMLEMLPPDIKQAVAAQVQMAQMTS